MSVERGRLTVLTGETSGSAGPLPATSSRKGNGMDLVPDELVQRWQAVYGAYLSMQADEPEMARLSAEVAAAWREMATVPGLAWWMVAALRTAAEAFDRQAGRMSGATDVPLGRPTERENTPRHQAAGDNWFRTSPSDDVDH